MQKSRSKPFDHLLHPYIFVLKEGTGIDADFLDYSLLLLHVGQADIIPSPRQKNRISSAIQFESIFS